MPNTVDAPIYVSQGSPQRMIDLNEIHRRTVETYEAYAQAWDEQRPKQLIEQEWLNHFVSCLPEGGSVLDAGCGAGDPIARYLLAQRLRVTGIDASSALLAIARTRFPNGHWIRMDMRELSLPQRFDGIIGWDSFFHLNPDEQRSALVSFCHHLKSGGVLMITIGDKAGEVLGAVNGQQVYHASLAPDEYRKILKSAGFKTVRMVLRDANCSQHSVLLASGYEGPSR